MAKPDVNSIVVLDASAVLCLLNGEKGSDRVASRLPQALISAVNVSEVVSKLSEAGGRADRIDLALRSLHLKCVVFDHEQAFIAGLLRMQTKPFGLSLGDRACLALAKQQVATALTADRIWAQLPAALGVQIEVVR